VGVIDDEEEAFSATVEFANFADDIFFDGGGVATLLFELQGLGEKAEEAVPTENGAVDDDDLPVFVRKLEEGLFEDGFACSGFADDDGEAAKEGLFFDAQEALFLLREEFIFEFSIGFKGCDGGSKVGINHGLDGVVGLVLMVLRGEACDHYEEGRVGWLRRGVCCFGRRWVLVDQWCGRSVW